MSAIALFGKMLSFSRLKIMTDDLAVVKSELESLVGGKTPIPVVINSDIELDLKACVDMLWELGIQPIGVVEGVLTKQANELRLATFPADGKRIERLKPAETKTDKKTPPATETDTHTNNTPDSDDVIATDDTPSTEVATTNDTTEKDTVDELFNVEIATTPQLNPNPSAFADDTLVQAVPTSTETGSFSQEVFDEEKGMTSSVHSYMLRSGQSVQHLGGDLVIIGGVNNGAEAITDNNLHIYGHGQGRLVAGATGDKDARIFCQKFNPSLVSVAGTYCLREAIPAEMIDKAVQVSYDADKGLIFTLMTH